MSKFFGFLLLAAVAGGVIWYESQPTTVTIPVKTSDTIGYYQEPTSTEPPVTVTQPQRQELGFSHPDVRLEVHGANGDDVVLQERIGRAKHIKNLPSDVRAVITSCMGVTDRDMVIPIQSRVELQSSLAAKISVNYHTSALPAVYDYDAGLECDDGRVSHDLKPGGHSLLSYWVVVTGVITPDHPNGDFRNSWTLDGPTLTLPNMEQMTWSMWGPDVVSCDTILGDETKIRMAGVMPVVGGTSCKPADLEALAVGNS